MARSRYQDNERERRLKLLLELLDDGTMTNCQTLAYKLGVSVRVAYRYIGMLRKQGHDIRGLHGHGGGVQLHKKKVPVAIRRLIEEVSVDEPVGGYNRTYHRHNR